MAINAFGDLIYSPLDILRDEAMSVVLKPTLSGICNELSITPTDAELLLQNMWKLSQALSERAIEEKLQLYFNQIVRPDVMLAALERRSVLIAKQIAPFLIGDSIADIGCGDGLVAWFVRHLAKKIALLDIQFYLDSRVLLPFYQYAEGQPLPITDQVHTSLLLTVLHHAQDPLDLLRKTRLITLSRAIIIESVFGVDVHTDSPPSILRQLDTEQQRKYASFIDWLYNRVFHDGVAVPYNFSTPEHWQEIFRSMGWRINRVLDLGIDQPIVPEHHVLFVLDTA